MNRLENMSKPLVWSTALLLTAIVAGCGGSTGAAGTPGTPGVPGTPAPGTNPSAVNLLSASTYALTTSAALSATGAASGISFGGNVAMDAPTSTCTATPANATIQTGGIAVDQCGMETGTIDFVNGPITPTAAAGLTITGKTIRYNPVGKPNSAAFNATVRAVKTDVNTAWQYAFNQASVFPISGPGALDGLILPPGVYYSASSMTLGTGQTLTLDAGAGNANAANAVWIFKVGSSLTVNGATVACSGTTPPVCTPTQVVLKNGALAKNVFWQVGTPDSKGALVAGGGDVTFAAATGAAGNNTIFAGTILAGNSVTLNTVALTGRVLAGAALSGVPNVQTGGKVTAIEGSTGPVTVTLP